MKLSDFDFTLQEELIAKYPAENREDSRMLVVPGNNNLFFKDFPSLLRESDILVLNNTRVLPVRLYGIRGEAKIEATLHKNISDSSWWSFVKGSKRLKIDDSVVFSENLTGVVKEKSDSGVLFEFNLSGQEFLNEIKKIGHMPLPPYMRREDDYSDKLRYQTVFAERDGSVAAPTAGLHFTEETLQKIRGKGVKIAYVTLHVGAGTFLPVKTENLDEHEMHSEWGEISIESADQINYAKAQGGRVIPVGTTALRILETVANEDGKLQSFSGETNIFITPGYQFKIVDAMLTNFHLPKSTLFMLVSALSGMEEMKSAYVHAIEYKYRFYSYGDCCFLNRK
ncbi:MAG: tRNA preQ1(34) S-adenosylmethionine ribosyltransferase-isomerase QueA [Alphaproteobacteria bacterium]|nr:tRNA preQ1(34) S-adenosylmethionine ribosyltransferase-isomerase QueA [Alphaproteobacteria bacterium]